MDGKSMSVGVYKREELPAGVALETPCIVTEYSATTIVPESAEALVDSHGNIILRLEKAL
jgi:N-methylhydantoinase A